jgi:hypothetical protein
MQMFSRFEFQKEVQETETEYHARGFSSWNHFTALLELLLLLPGEVAHAK